MKLFLSLLCLISSTQLFGQNCETCNAALRKDIFSYSTNNYLLALYAAEITENEFNEMKKDFHHNGKVPIPWLGGIVEGSFDYNQFENKIHEYISKVQTETTLITSTNFKEVSTNPMAYPSWEKCMESCNSRSGVFIFKTEDGENFGQYKLRYVPAPRESDSIFCTITINTEDSTIIQDAIIYKNGSATYTYPRKYTNGVSETIISVNASQTYRGGVSYSDKMSSKYIKPSGLKVNSLNYSYEVTISKLEIGESVQNCMLKILQPTERPHPGDRGGRNSIVANIGSTLNLYSSDASNGCASRELGRSCDNKYSGFFVIVQIKPSEGYEFRQPISYNQLKLEGPMAAWNWMQRCPQNDKFIVDKSDIKQMKLWLHQDVTAHLEMMSYKDSIVQETTFANIDYSGTVSFIIPTSRLNNYSIDIRLSNGNNININSNNVNDKAYLNTSGSNTIFTLKNIAR